MSTKKALAISGVTLALGLIFLVCFTYFPITRSTGTTVQATVIANTLTQSLDGHRRYLTVAIDSVSSLRVSVPSTVDCPIGSTVELNQQSSRLTKQINYQFIRCRWPQD